MPKQRPLSGKLIGLNEFSEQWTAICKRLIATKTAYLKSLSPAQRQAQGLPDPPNLNYAPKGPFREIVTIEAGTAFATIAKRAFDRDYFDPSDFATAVLKGELVPFGITPDDLSDGARDRALNRIGMSIGRLMKTFVFFELFEPVKTFYRLTNNGVKTYEELTEDSVEEDPVAIDAGSGSQFMGRYSGPGTARGSYTQVTLHRYY